MKFRLADEIIEKIDRIISNSLPNSVMVVADGVGMYAGRCIECGNNCAWDCVSSCHYTCQSACEKANAHDSGCSYFK